MAFHRFIVSAFMMAAAARGEDILGTVVVKQRLTRQRVTTSADIYERGPSVALHSDSSDDPLAAERARVVVYLEGQFPSSPVDATMEQKERRFIPELLVIPAGSTVSFPNLDPIFHNVFSLSRTKSFDLGNYPRNHTRTVTFNKPGIEFVNCHLHPNMSAAIVVTPNAWCTTADRTGRFRLHGVPAGTYTIVAWHKAAGAFRQPVMVAPQQGASVEFLVPLSGDGPEYRTEARR